MSATWDTSELDELGRDLGKAAERADELSKTVVAKTGLDTVATAQDTVHVDTGNLKGSIGVDFDADGLGFDAGSEVEYAGFHEFGTSRTRPYPYMIPSFNHHAEKAGQAVDQIPRIVLW